MKSHINIFPLKTEKSYTQSQNNIYVFSVSLDANKQMIASAVESQFGVKVTNIKTLVQKGKAIRFSKGKRTQPGSTNRRDTKKAYVTLAKGDSIKVFDEVSEPESKPEKKKEKK